MVRAAHDTRYVDDGGIGLQHESVPRQEAITQDRSSGPAEHEEDEREEHEEIRQRVHSPRTKNSDQTKLEHDASHAEGMNTNAHKRQGSMQWHAK